MVKTGQVLYNEHAPFEANLNKTCGLIQLAKIGKEYVIPSSIKCNTFLKVQDDSVTEEL